MKRTLERKHYQYRDEFILIDGVGDGLEDGSGNVLGWDADSHWAYFMNALEKPKAFIAAAKETAFTAGARVKAFITRR